MQVHLNPSSVDDYRKFLKIKSIPRYQIQGRTATIPNEYAGLVGGLARSLPDADYSPSDFLFDYQGAIARIAIRKRKFAVFARCGLGKSLMFLEYAKHVRRVMDSHKNILIVSPLMVVEQSMEECARWYGDSIPIEQVRSSEINAWSQKTGRIGITNYEAIDRLNGIGNIGCIILDESSQLKGMTGKHALQCIELGRGLDWKLALTGTPAPNDRIEYANHAVFLDQFRTTNEFLARYFINRGETSNRWELKPHALKPFYRGLSDWCIFLNNPAVYGWKDNCETIPPIYTHLHDVETTSEQESAVRGLTRSLIGGASGGIAQRGKLAQIAKGHLGKKLIASNKPEFIRQLVESWPDESTIIWCKYNAEQDGMAKLFPDCANISGDTPIEKRRELIADFKAGRRRQLISKADILGFGLNLQVCTRHVFSTCMDSYEDWWQCICRSNRVGSTKPLNVHIPVTDIEYPMVQNVLEKAKRVDQDIAEQESLFRESTLCC